MSFYEKFGARNREDWLRYNLLLVSNKPTILISNYVEGDVREALANLKREDPDGYANLTEMLDLPEEWLPT